ncbi:hypothetical protein DL764_007389 [Monosporascus ibericus]|uniref:Heterokaryon incompatibility domain-containing protein n=1 Tax=Monosporascus ibericus TaxID=155417 RepID=A0A4Q4T0X4_9PEZI|nr:hypothetical protein DL764_007389 [Monosporascus ibericus]
MVTGSLIDAVVTVESAPGAKLGNSYDPCITEEYDIVRRLWAQLWFARAWIIQEAVLSSSIVVLFGEGDRHATGDFDHMAKLAERPLDGQPGQLQSAAGKRTELFGGGFKRRLFWGVVGIRLEYGRSEDAIELIDALATARGATATDPRDKVYGLMDMLSDDREAITVLLVGGPCGYGPKEPPILTKPDIKDTNAAILVWTCYSDKDLTPEFSRQVMNLIAGLIAKDMGERVMSITNMGFLATVPKEAKEGDEIVLICGGSRPFVVWPDWGGEGEVEKIDSVSARDIALA